MTFGNQTTILPVFFCLPLTLGIRPRPGNAHNPKPYDTVTAKVHQEDHRPEMSELIPDSWVNPGREAVLSSIWPKCLQGTRNDMHH